MYILKNKNLLTSRRVNNQKGAAMFISVIFFLFISLAIVAGLVSPTLTGFRVASADLKSKSSYFLAESGVEDAFYRLIKNKPISASENISLGNNSATTTITTLSGNRKQIQSSGDVSDFQRKVNLTLNTGSGVSFNYGVQVGQGGLTMTGGTINGNVYANGPIIGSSSSFITGTAISGNSPALNAEQLNGDGVPQFNISFGNNNATQDIAQGFQVDDLNPINKVQFYIKKINSPSDATVKIVNDINGTPGTTVLSSGILSASLVTSSYGWVDVAMSSNFSFYPNTTYWLVIDASTSSNNYYILGASSDTYANGVGKIGRLSSTWNNLVNSYFASDYFFKIFTGGFTGLIQGSGNSQWNQFNVGSGGNGSAQAHTINYTEATGSILCQVGTGNNKACVSQPDPVYQAMPISDANIEQWKADALAGGIINQYNPIYNTPDSGASNLGPIKLPGDLNVTGSHTLYVKGTIWVHGNLTVSGTAKIVLDSSYGNKSGIIVSDGWLSLGGSSQLNGTGQPGSYILFATTSNCSSSTLLCGTHNAIDISGDAGSVVLSAQNGTIAFSGSAKAKEATAYKLKLDGNPTLSYESGLANMNFMDGPSGGWSVSNWKEIK